MNNFIQVVPVTKTTSITVSQVKISNIRVNLDSTADCSVELYNESGDFLEIKQSSLNPTQYAAWSSDDNYFVKTVLQNIGIQCQTGPYSV